MNKKLYILCGLPFSGKSTLAKAMVNRLGFIRIDLDDIKFELYGNTIKDEELQQSDWDKIYQEMYAKIEKSLQENKNVINDTGNFTKYERELVRSIAQKLNKETITIYVNTPEAICLERLLKNRETNERFDVTEASFKATVTEMEIPDSSENAIIYNYQISVDEWIVKNLHF